MTNAQAADVLFGARRPEFFTEERARHRVPAIDANLALMEALELRWEAERLHASGDTYGADEALLRAGMLYYLADAWK